MWTLISIPNFFFDRWAGVQGADGEQVSSGSDEISDQLSSAFFSLSSSSLNNRTYLFRPCFVIIAATSVLREPHVRCAMCGLWYSTVQTDWIFLTVCFVWEGRCVQSCVSRNLFGKAAWSPLMGVTCEADVSKSLSFLSQNVCTTKTKESQLVKV